MGSSRPPVVLGGTGAQMGRRQGLEISFVSFTETETFIEVTANINLQSCKDFGLCVTKGKVQHNHRTPSA